MPARNRLSCWWFPGTAEGTAQTAMNMAVTGRGGAQAGLTSLPPAEPRAACQYDLGPVSSRTVISAWPVMSTAISRATS
jgi:hypothetical protein